MRWIHQAISRGRSVRADERGVEIPAMIIVIPFLFVLILGLIDVGNMIRVRMLVDNVARDAVRSAAADGGNFYDATNVIGQSWESEAHARLVIPGTNRCSLSACHRRLRPADVDCRTIRRANGTTYRSDVAERSGDVITCRIDYPFRAINEGLMNSPLGLNIGALLNDWTSEASARAETGATG